MLLAGITAFAVFAVVDVMIVEGNLAQVLTIRVVATVIALFFWGWFCITDTPDKREALIGAIGLVFVIANLIIIMGSAPPIADLLPFSISMILAFGFGLVAPRFRTSVWTALTAYGLYWASVPFSQTSTASIATNAHFLSLSTFAALAGTFVREKLEREQANAQHRLSVLNAKLIDADLAKDRLLASVSHELRTPVNAIGGFSEVMQQGIFGPVEPSRYRSYIDDIHYSAGLLKTSIDDLLEVSRLGVQKIAWKESVESLSRTVASSVAICQADAQEAGVSIDFMPVDKSISVETDQQRLMQTLINIIANAIKFSHRGSEVNVRVESPEDGGIVIKVTDTGCGIAPKDLGLIREPFGQVHTDQYNTRKGGLGLGLTIASGFIDKMEGCLDIDSVLGKGTTVSIKLPQHRIVRKPRPTSRVERAVSA